jgi:hypothetical protein
MYGLFLFLLGVLAFIVPGFLLILVVYRGRSWEEAVIRAPSFGFAAGVYVAFTLSYIQLALFWYAWALIALALALMLWRRQFKLPGFALPDLYGRWLFIVVGLVLVTRLAPTFWQLLPPGWDPSFHLLLAKKMILAGGMIFDWQPFELSKLNYPVGSHVLLAELNLLTGVPLHTIFKFLIPIFGAITTAQIFFLTARISGPRELALYSCMAYGLLAVWGSIDYYRWGGLPNLIAMSFFLECLIILTEKEVTFRESALFGLLFVAIFFTHHHVMITAGITCVAVWIFYYVHNRDRQKAKVIFQGLLISLILGAFYIVPYVIKIRMLSNTSVLTFAEGYISFETIYRVFGVNYSRLICLGVALYVLQILRKRENRFDPLLFVVILTLTTLFVFFEYVYRIASIALYGSDRTAFTPSRFATDLVYFLAVFAGYGVYFIRRRLPLGSPVGVSLAAVVLLLLSYSNFDEWTELFAPSMPSDRFLALEWISKHLPANTIVLTDDPYAAYITWRRTLNTPMPVSEPAPWARRLSSAEIADIRLSGKASEETLNWKIVAVGSPASAAGSDVVLWKTPSGLESVILRKDSD